MFGNVSSKGRYPVVEGGDICWVAGISGSVERNDRFAEVTIKCSAHIS